MNRVFEALGPLALGLALAGASHPAFAGLIGASGRPLTVGHMAELALNHLTWAATGLTLVAALGIGLGLIATRVRFAGFRTSIDTLAAFAQAVPPVLVR